MGMSTQFVYAFVIFCSYFLFTSALRFIGGYYWAIFAFVLLSTESGNLFGNALRHALAGGLVLYAFTLQRAYLFFVSLLAVGIHLSASIYLPYLIVARVSNANRSRIFMCMFVVILMLIVAQAVNLGAGADENFLVAALQALAGDSLLTISNLTTAPSYTLYRVYFFLLLFFSAYWIFALNLSSLPKGNIPRSYIDLMLVGNLSGLLIYVALFGIGATGRILLVPIFFNTVVSLILLGDLVRPLLSSPVKGKRPLAMRHGGSGPFGKSP